MIALQTYRQGPQVLVAACDEELVGQVFEEDGIRLDVAANFYDGERVETPELQRSLEQATIANLVGPNAVAVAKEMGLVEEVREVDGVPHAQFMVLLP